jgi:hypothetical protein
MPDPGDHDGPIRAITIGRRAHFERSIENEDVSLRLSLLRMPTGMLAG